MAFITKSGDRDRVSIAHGFKFLVLDCARQSELDYSGWTGYPANQNERLGFWTS